MILPASPKEHAILGVVDMICDQICSCTVCVKYMLRQLCLCFAFAIMSACSNHHAQPEPERMFVSNGLGSEGARAICANNWSPACFGGAISESNLREARPRYFLGGAWATRGQPPYPALLTASIRGPVSHCGPCYSQPVFGQTVKMTHITHSKYSEVSTTTHATHSEHCWSNCRGLLSWFATHIYISSSSEAPVAKKFHPTCRCGFCSCTGLCWELLWRLLW